MTLISKSFTLNFFVSLPPSPFEKFLDWRLFPTTKDRRQTECIWESSRGFYSSATNYETLYTDKYNTLS